MGRVLKLGAAYLVEGSLGDGFPSRVEVRQVIILGDVQRDFAP